MIRAKITMKLIPRPVFGWTRICVPFVRVRFFAAEICDSRQDVPGDPDRPPEENRGPASRFEAPEEQPDRAGPPASDRAGRRLEGARPPGCSGPRRISRPACLLRRPSLSSSQRRNATWAAGHCANATQCPRPKFRVPRMPADGASRPPGLEGRQALALTFLVQAFYMLGN